MKNPLMTLTLLSSLMLTVPVNSHADPVGVPHTPWNVNARQEHQADRIDQGIKSGQLTEAEAKKLEKKQDRIARKEAELSADGELSKKDHVRLRRMQARQNGAIHRKKHNNRSAD